MLTSILWYHISYYTGIFSLYTRNVTPKICWKIPVDSRIIHRICFSALRKCQECSHLTNYSLDSSNCYILSILITLKYEIIGQVLFFFMDTFNLFSGNIRSINSQCIFVHDTKHYILRRIFLACFQCSRNVRQNCMLFLNYTALYFWVYSTNDNSINI